MASDEVGVSQLRGAYRIGELVSLLGQNARVGRIPELRIM